jgi:hypothetical protein
MIALVNGILGRRNRLFEGTHPCIMIAMWINPNWFSTLDIVTISRRFLVGGIQLTSAHADIIGFRDDLLNCPAVFSLSCLQDKTNSIVRHSSWLYFILLQLNGFKNSLELKDALLENNVGKLQSKLADIAHTYCQDVSIWCLPWATISINHIIWIYDSMRLFNMYEVNPTDSDHRGMSHQILSTLLWLTDSDRPDIRNGLKHLIYRLTGHSAPLTLRHGSSFTWGPEDGKGYNSGTPPYGPATEEFPRVRMNLKSGSTYAKTLPNRPHDVASRRVSQVIEQSDDQLETSDVFEALSLETHPQTAGFPVSTELINTQAVKMAYKQKVHYDNSIEWSRQSNHLSVYSRPTTPHNFIFSLVAREGLSAGCLAVHNSLRASDEFNYNTPFERIGVDCTFEREYEYILRREIKTGTVVMILDPFWFYHTCVQTLDRGDFALSRYSRNTLHHLYVSEVDRDNNTMTFRTLLTEGTGSESGTMFPPEDQDHCVPLPKRGVFAVVNSWEFLQNFHLNFTTKLPLKQPKDLVKTTTAVEQLPVLEEEVTTHTTGPPSPARIPTPAPAKSSNQAARIPAPATAKSGNQESRSVTSNKGPKSNRPAQDRQPADTRVAPVQHAPIAVTETPPGKKKRRRRNNSTFVNHALQANKNWASEDEEDQDQESKRSRQSSDEVSTTSASAPGHSLRTVLGSMNGTRSYHLQDLELPPKPVRDTPCLCLVNWAFVNGVPPKHDCPGMFDGRCDRLHRKDLVAGVISYESIRFQICHYYHERRSRVDTLFDLVEKEKDLFLPERM